jgi:O-antigen/teichoic acid export membrane protein/capsular polysaccharide biosynthesis protein
MSNLLSQTPNLSNFSVPNSTSVAVADDALTGLGRRSALGFLGAAVSGIATIVTIIIASRSLSDQGTGQFFVATSVFAIAQGLCSLGIDTGLQYWMPALSPAGGRALLRRTVPLVGFVGAATAVAFWFGADQLSRVLADDSSSNTADLLRTSAMLLPFAGLYEVAFGALRACDRIKLSVLLDRVLRPLAQVVCMAGVALFDGSPTAMVFGWAGPFVAAAVGAVVLVGQGKATAKLSGEMATVSNRQFWNYTTPRTIARTAQVLTQRIDVILLAGLASLEDAGIYGTVSRCMIAGVFVATAVQQVVQPRLRKLVVKGDIPSVKEMYGASTTWLVLATWPAFLTMAICAPLVLKLFGERFERGAAALTILCLTMLVASACGLVDVVLLMLGRSWLSTVDVLVALALNVGLNILLIPHFGMVGAAIAWSVAILTTNLLPLWQVSRQGIHPNGPPLRTAMLVSASAFAFPLLIGRALKGDGIFALSVSLCVGLFVFCVAVFASRRRLLIDRFFSDLAGRTNSSSQVEKEQVVKEPKAARHRMSDIYQSTASDGGGIGPDVVQVLRRQWKPIAILSAIGLLAALALVFTSSGQYESRATVLVAALKGDSAPGGGKERTVNIETQATVAKSTKLIVIVAEKLGLDETRVRKSVGAEAAPTGDVLLLSYVDDDPEIALQGATVLAEQYLEQRKANALALIDTTRTQLEETATQLEKDLADLTTQIADEAAKNPGVTSVRLQSLLQVQDLTIRQQASGRELLSALKTTVDPGRIVVEPRLPSARNGPSKLLTLIGGLLAGLLAGVTLALFRDRKDDTYRGVTNLDSLGISEIGRVQFMPKMQLMTLPAGSPERRSYQGLLLQICFLSGLPGGAFKSLQLVAIESDSLPVNAARNLADALSFEAYESGTAMALLATSGEDGSQAMDTGSIWETLPGAITDLAAEHDVVLAVSPPFDTSMNGVAVASLVDRTILLVSESTKLADVTAAVDGMQRGKSVSIVVITRARR